MNILGLENVLGSSIKIAAILVVAFLATRLVKLFIVRFLRRFIKKSLHFGGVSTQIDKEREQTLTKVSVSVIRAVIWVIAILTILPELGINIAPLLAGLGVAGLALSFGARSLIQDYLSGLFILLEDHYRVGEQVDILGTKGKIKDFNLRRTIIESPDGVFHYIPNSQIKKTSNLSRKEKQASKQKKKTAKK